MVLVQYPHHAMVLHLPRDDRRQEESAEREEAGGAMIRTWRRHPQGGKDENGVGIGRDLRIKINRALNPQICERTYR